MKKPKYITVDNYLQFKPSEFVRSFASDIERGWELAKRTKQKIDLYNWVPYPESKCLPCVGGLACMYFGGEFTYEGSSAELYKGSDLVKFYTARIGDCIRMGSMFEIYEFLIGLYPEYKNVYLGKWGIAFYGMLNAKSKGALIKRINRIADLIEASGQ